MKEKKEKLKSAEELFHHFANQTNNNNRKGEYHYIGTNLYKNNRILAKLVDLKNKIVLVDDLFYTSMGGYSSSSIIRCFSSDYKILKYYDLNKTPDKLEDFTEELKFNIAAYMLFNSIKNNITAYRHQKYLIENKNLYKPLSFYKEVNPDVFNYLKLLKVKKANLLKHIYNDSIIISKYEGWGTKTIEYYKIDKPFSFFLNQDKWHNKEEKEVLAFKEWKRNNIESGYGTRFNKTYEEIYNDKDLSKQYQEGKTNFIAETKERKRKKEELLKEQNLLKEKDNLEKWLKGEKVNSLYNIPIHLRIIEKNRIETTKGAVVPLEAGKKLYQMLLKFKNDNIGKKEEMKVGVYNFDRFGIIAGHYYVVVGCHNIYEKEIEKFIEDNNLQEWKNI